MQRPPKMETQIGEWKVTFQRRGARLACRHTPTGVRIAGALAFRIVDPRGIRGEGDWRRDWRIEIAWPGDKWPLYLVSPDGDAQAYIGFEADGPELRIRAVNRPRQVFRGELTYAAALRAGDRAFACRTRTQVMGPVLQMAAGPADSALNDSIFDIARDRAVRFDAPRVAVATEAPSRGATNYRVALAAEAGATSGDAIALSVETDFYRTRYVPWYRPIDKRRAPSAPTGWMSWNTWFDQAGEEENLSEARVGAEHLKAYGLEYWSIESWQEASDHQPVRAFHNLTMRAHPEQFPHGMKWLSAEIRKLGFKPGIWTVPFGTGSREFYETHKSWFLHDAKGKPMGNWSGLYVLDPSQPRVRKFMRDTHREMAEDWDYDFFKIDGMSGYCKSYNAHFFELPHVRAAFRNKCDDPFRLCIKALRDGIGPDRVFLACQGHHTGSEVEYCDATRIGSDIVGVCKPAMWHNYYDQALRSQTLLHCHNIIWYSDPDTLLVGENASLDTARMATAVVALPGQMMFAGDRMAELPAERMWLLQRALPVCDVRPLDLFPVFEIKDIWDLKVRRDFADWDIVSVFNFGEKNATKKVRFADLGVDPSGEYLVYEFWSGRFLGAEKRGFSVDVPSHGCALLAVHRALGRPQFLSTDRHVTQGATSLEAMAWDDAKATLSGTTRLVPGETSILAFHVPKGWSLDKADARRAGIETTVEGAILRMSLTPKRSETCDWSLRFRAPAST